MRLSCLPLREREVASIVCARGEASAVDVSRDLSDPLTNSAVRSMLRRLEAKGVLRRRKEGRRFIYAPAGGDQARRDSALRWISREHFGGSLAATAAAALELARAEASNSALNTSLGPAGAPGRSGTRAPCEDRSRRAQYGTSPTD